MTRLEKMKELLSLPVEELAEKICNWDGKVACELRMLWDNETVDPCAYCRDNHKECPYLNTDYDYDDDCSGLYGNCTLLADEECPYGVDRKEVLKNAIIESLNEEV